MVEYCYNFMKFLCILGTCIEYTLIIFCKLSEFEIQIFNCNLIDINMCVWNEYGRVKPYIKHMFLSFPF